MKLLIVVVPFLMIVLLYSCDSANENQQVENEQKESLTAQDIIENSYSFYGVDKLLKSNVSFKFRKHNYSLERNQDGIIRTRMTVDSDSLEIKDVWTGNGVQRFINDSLQTIEKEKGNAYRNSINSVFYFAFLPKGLTDSAVNIELLDEVKIKGVKYYKIRVTFDEEGGGEDHHDIFVYWFDKEDFSMDYLAYEYFTEGGGIRFREAINIREINGITFQDYINYKPKSDKINLEDTDKAFENGNLKEVSRIELENVSVD